MERDFWVSAAHDTSRRVAVIADEGESVWLYLTDADGAEIRADCWLFNRVPAPSTDEIKARREVYKTRGVPPPAARDVVDERAHLAQPLDTARARFVWSRDGEAVAAWVDGQLAGFIAPGEKRGYSAHLRQDCSWGRPLNLALHDELFDRIATDSSQ